MFPIFINVITQDKSIGSVIRKVSMDKNHLRKNYDDKGYVVVKNLFNSSFIKKVCDNVISIKNCDIYYDDKNLIRRMENIYEKDEYLAVMNNKIKSFLLDVFSLNFVIFKDKYNCKPAGGEGFVAHYDGIFMWTDQYGSLRRGWEEYAPSFVNVLIALDRSNKLNGTIEIAEQCKMNFDDCLSNTKQNGTPQLKASVEEKTKFKVIDLNPGDAVVFSNKCPHRSSRNRSKTGRRMIFYTYNELKYGDHYDKYFYDKCRSNKGKLVDKSFSMKDVKG